MSAEVLREAARLMRERAEAAQATVQMTSAETWERAIAGVVNGSLLRREKAHAASWNPAVALAVADWLDEAANLDHRMPHRQPQIDPDAWVISWCCQECGEAVSDAASVLTECPVDWRSRNPLALAVARAYLGDQP